MKTIKFVICSFTVLLLSTTAFTQDSETEDQESKLIAQRHPDVFKHRAFEAAVWAMPMMNFKGNRDGYFANGVTYNDVGYFSKMQDSHYQLATPNNTTPYFLSFWNIKEKPVVVEMPAANGHGFLKSIILYGE